MPKVVFRVLIFTASFRSQKFLPKSRWPPIILRDSTRAQTKRAPCIKSTGVKPRPHPILLSQYSSSGASPTSAEQKRGSSQAMRDGTEHPERKGIKSIVRHGQRLLPYGARRHARAVPRGGDPSLLQKKKKKNEYVANTIFACPKL